MAKNLLHLSPVGRDVRSALDFRAGDTIRVWQKVPEGEKGDKFRLQAFEGMVLARKHGAEASATFTVRRVASGVGMERIFPLYSPMVDKIEILKRARARRAKLYFVREKAVKEVTKKMRAVAVSKGEGEKVPVAPVVVEATA